MNEPRSPRTASPSPSVGSQARAPVRDGVRSALRAAPAHEEREWLARAWARHPLVAMVRHRPRLTFFQGLHRMIRAGIGLPIAFSELSRGAARDPFRRAVAQVGEAVAAGSSLADAMRRHPRWFESQTVELLGAAEAAGTLESALERIVEQMEEAQRMRWRAVSLCAYPAYLLVAFVFGGALLDTAGSLSASGRVNDILGMFLSHFIRKVLQVGSAGLAAFLAPLVLAAPGIAPLWSDFRMRVPLLGRVHRELQASRFSLVLGATLGAGLEVGRSLQMALEATGSARLRARANLALHRLRTGATLTDVVEWLDVFDGESLQRVATGERTGDLEPVLTGLSREHADTAMRWLRTLMFVIIALLSVFLFATNIGKVVQLQSGYQRQLGELEQLERR
ncbi:type II secretion system F family protein [Archangium violaceum]|uniref:type II secretion system F family protein n=1 Tax=Archangium violaceum TaxID=83451 RepID=UPI00193C6532|nr:type II secretion system F family protein [Archangium violaceum]QRK09101.1 type II secretion system F family protein [Archangium violaceum]